MNHIQLMSQQKHPTAIISPYHLLHRHKNIEETPRFDKCGNKVRCVLEQQFSKRHLRIHSCQRGRPVIFLLFFFLFTCRKMKTFRLKNRGIVHFFVVWKFEYYIITIAEHSHLNNSWNTLP